MYKKHVGLTAKTTAIIIVVILIIVGVAFAAYYYVTPKAVPSQRGIIKVGFSISLTGNFNVEGTKSLAGIQAAAQWINDNGGITVGGKAYNISLVYYDDASTTGNIVPLYTRLITTDKVQFLLAPYSSGLTAAAAPLADQYNLIMISHGGASDSIWTKGYKNVFGVLSPASMYLKTAVDYIKANHPTDKLAFLYASDPFSALAGASAANYAKSLGLNVVYNSSYPSTITDLSPQLTAAKANGADDLIGGGHFNDGLLIVKQLKSVGWTPKFISLLVAVTEPQFQIQLGAAANLVTGPSQWEKTANYNTSVAQKEGISFFGPTTQQFLTYYSKFDPSGQPSYHSGEAAAAILVLADAIQTANSLDTSAVRNALLNLHIMTFFGPYQVDSTGKQVAHQMVLVQWQNGKLVLVQPSEVATAPLQYPYTGS